MAADMISISPLMYLLVLAAVFFAGFVDSVAGGGGLISMPAYTLTGMPMHLVYGCNKFSSACGTTLSALRYWKNGMADVPVGLISAFSALCGSALASVLVLHLSETVLHLMLLILLPAVAILVLFRKPKEDVNHSHALSRVKKIVFAVLIGFFIGSYDGLFGPGTGTLAVLAYSLGMGYDMRTSSGNAKFLNLASNYASLTVFLFAGNVYFPLAIPAALANIAGNYFGSGLAIQKGSKFIHSMMTVAVVLLFINLIPEMLPSFS